MLIAFFRKTSALAVATLLEGGDLGGDLGGLGIANKDVRMFWGSFPGFQCPFMSS